MTAFANARGTRARRRRLSLESSAFPPEAVSCRPCRSTFARALPASRCSRSSWRSSRLRRTADLQVEVRGVGEDIRANVLAYLSFERYKNSDDLSPEFVERLQERSEREVRGALRPFGYYEPTVTSEVQARGQRRRAELSRHHHHHARQAGGGRQGRREGHRARAPPTRCSPTSPTTCRSRPATRLNHSNYESLKGGLLRAAATYGYLDARMVRNEMRVDPQAYVAQVTIEFETGERYRFGETTITQDAIDDALVRRFLRYKAGRAVRRHRTAAHPVRARRQPVFLHGRGAARGARSRASHRAGQHHRRAEPPPSLLSSASATAPTPRCAARSPGKTGASTRAVTASARKSKAAALAQSLDARYIVPIGDPATEKFTLQLTGEHERRADVDDRTVDFIPSLTHVRALVVRRALLAARHLRRVAAHRIRVRRVGPHRHSSRC